MNLVNTKVNNQEASYIAELMHCLKSDPNATDYEKNYKKTEQYLRELIEKDGSVLSGLIYAIEVYLKK